MLCSSAYHKSDFNLTKGVYISKSLVICEDHPNEVLNITSKLNSRDHNVFTDESEDMETLKLIVANFALQQEKKNNLLDQLERENDLLNELNQEIKEKNLMLKSEIDNLKSKKNVEPLMSFAEITKLPKQLSKLNPQITTTAKSPYLLVASHDIEKKDEATGKVKSALSKIKEVNTEAVKTKHNGTAVVYFKNDADRKIAQDFLNKELRKDCLIFKQELNKPKIKIVGIEDTTLCRDDLLQGLVERNLIKRTK